MGIAAKKVLEGTGIKPSEIADPNFLIERDRCQAIIENMIRLSKDPGIGFKMGSETDLLSFGITAYAMITSRYMGETLEVWGQYSEPLLGMMSKLNVENDARGDVTLTIIEPSQASPIFMFCVEEILSMTCKTGAVQCGVPPSFVRLELPYPPPPHRHRYTDLVKCPIRFNAQRARATISKEYIELPLLANDEEFHRICLEHCSQVLHKINRGSQIATELRKIFLASPQHIPSLEEVANKLALSSRTLRRRLQDEGYSYQSLVRDFRVDLAREYLNSTKMSPKEIAYLLGFDCVQSFRRAFKAWTGQTVKGYRLSAKG